MLERIEPGASPRDEGSAEETRLVNMLVMIGGGVQPILAASRSWIIENLNSGLVLYHRSSAQEPDRLLVNG